MFLRDPGVALKRGTACSPLPHAGSAAYDALRYLTA